MKIQQTLGGRIPSQSVSSPRAGNIDTNMSPVNKRFALETRLRDMYNEGAMSPEDYLTRKKRLRELMDSDDYESQLEARGGTPGKMKRNF